jgi:hypothetical protein
VLNIWIFGVRFGGIFLYKTTLIFVAWTYSSKIISMLITIPNEPSEFATKYFKEVVYILIKISTPSIIAS